MQAYAITSSPFASSEAQFASLTSTLATAETERMSHAEVEALLESEGRELLRRLLQDHLTLRAQHERERGLTRAVVGSEGVPRTHQRASERGLMSLFGPVRVARLAYGARGYPSRHPLDAALNLPEDTYSHGVRRRVAEEAAKNSFDETVQAMRSTTGAAVPKRQAEELVVRAAQDFELFYATRAEATRTEAARSGAVLVVSVDGKGVVMRRDDLREATRRAAEERRPKLATRASKGEKRGAKRMATVAAVYTIAPFVRTPEQVVGDLRGLADASERAVRPRPEGKRVWASLVKEPAEVIGEAFQEALRRDPDRTKRWVALVDGNATQLRLLQAAAREHGVALTIVLDVIHVLEYLWKAAWVLHREGTPEAESWVRERLACVLRGEASTVAAGMRRSATRRGLAARIRGPVDTCARYLLKHRRFLRYDRCLAAGLPIATGVIEGACRHLVKDRMDVTGARWSLAGAEAVLRLRSLRASGDFDEYWTLHQRRELLTNHQMRYAAAIPTVRSKACSDAPRHLRLVTRRPSS